MDAHPVQLVEEVEIAVAATREHPKRVDYEYKRVGVANVFMFTEPLTAWRQVFVRSKKTQLDWALGEQSAIGHGRDDRIDRIVGMQNATADELRLVPEVKEGVQPILDIAIGADAVASAIHFAVSQPLDVDVNEIIIRPSKQVLCCGVAVGQRLGPRHRRHVAGRIMSRIGPVGSRSSALQRDRITAVAVDLVDLVVVPRIEQRAGVCDIVCATTGRVECPL